MDRMQEVLICESELLEGNIYKPMPVFLNLSFDELCHQGRGDEHMMICAVMKEGDDLYPLRRVLSLLEKGNSSMMYFWIAKSGTKSARQVTDKFGSNSPATELFILAPTTSKPVLVERFSGDTLSNVKEEELMNAIQQGKKSLEGLRNEKERTIIIDEQAKELKESLNIDKKKTLATHIANKNHLVANEEGSAQKIQAKTCARKDKTLANPIVNKEEANEGGSTQKSQETTGKDETLATPIATKKVANEGGNAQVRKDRTNRITKEPKEGFTIVLRFDQQKLSRKFRKSAMFQEVYDWAGAMKTMPLHFTIQRRSEVVMHDHAIQGDEVLDVYAREEKEVKALLSTQVSFRGNLPEESLEKLDVTEHGETSENDGKSSIHEEEETDEKKTEKRKKEKRSGSQRKKMKKKDGKHI